MNPGTKPLGVLIESGATNWQIFQQDASGKASFRLAGRWITTAKFTTATVLVDTEGIARSHREAPEIDGIVNVPSVLQPGTFHTVKIVAAEGPDLEAQTLEAAR